MNIFPKYCPICSDSLIQQFYTNNETVYFCNENSRQLLKSYKSHYRLVATKPEYLISDRSFFQCFIEQYVIVFNKKIYEVYNRLSTDSRVVSTIYDKNSNILFSIEERISYNMRAFI